MIIARLDGEHRFVGLIRLKSGVFWCVTLFET